MAAGDRAQGRASVSGAGLGPHARTVYVTIGNSDDKLTQAEWARYYAAVDTLIRSSVSRVWGAWVSESTSRYQNACWAFSTLAVAAGPGSAEWLRDELRLAARQHRQDSIAWVEGTAEFLSAAEPVAPAR